MKRTAVTLAVALLIGNSEAISLQEFISSAEVIDPTLQAAIANRDASNENIAIATSKLLPQVNSVSSFQKTRQDFIEPTTLVSRADSVNAQISLRQALFRPKDWAGLTIGQLQAEYGAYKLESAKSDLWLRISLAWSDFLIAAEIKKIQDGVLHSVAQASKQGKSRLKAGDGTRDAAAELEAQLELAKAQAIEADYNLQAKRSIFQSLTGLDKISYNQLSKLSAYKTLSLPMAGDDIKQQILELNPEIWATKIAEKINKGRLSQAKFDHYPTVDIIGSYANLQSDTVATTGAKYNYGQYGVQIIIPLFSGGGVSATERQAASTWSASIAEARAVEQKILNQFSVEWAGQLAARERVKSARSLVDAAQLQRKSAEMSLKQGVKSWTDLASAELQLSRREVDLLNLIGSQVKSQARVLSLLPVHHSAWSIWIGQMNVKNNSHVINK